MKSTSKLAAIAIVASLLGGAVSAENFKRIRKEADFAAQVEGRILVGEIGSLTFHADRKLTADIVFGKGVGIWEWHKGYWCRNVVIDNKSGGTDCQLVRQDGDVFEFVAERGKGKTFTVTRK